MALRDELLGIKGIGPTLADQIMAVVEDFAPVMQDETAHPGLRMEGCRLIGGTVIVDDKIVNTLMTPMDGPLVTALRAAKTGCNPPNGCPLCGVDGCNERCPAWGV